MTLTYTDVVDVFDKSTGELIDSIPADTAESTTAALERARDGFREWAAFSAHRRAEILHRFADALVADRDELAVLLARETGKIVGNARGEIEAAARIFKGFADESLRHFGQSIPLDRQAGLEGDLMITLHEPLGVVAAIVAFNFPAELYAHKVAAALAAGNAVVVKPAEKNPLIGTRMTQMLHEAGVPRNVLQVVNGDGAVVGDTLSRSPIIRAISFTGSSRVGSNIAQNAARNVVRTFLELSANDALIVLDDADVEHAVDESIAGRLLANGQVCCATKRIIVAESVSEAFLGLLEARLRSVVVGTALDESVMVGPLISEDAAIGVAQQIAHAVSQGGKILFGGNRAGATVEPTVLRVPADADIAHDDEVFGPVFTVVVVSDDSTAVEVANAPELGLTAAVFSKDTYRAYRIAEKLEAAIVSINGSNNYRPDGSSFGGYKKSGLGREGYFGSLDEYTQLKSIVFRGMRG